MDRTIAVSDLDEQLPAADSQVKPTAGKSGLAQGGLPHTRCCSSALARSREGLCLIRPSQDGQGLGRSASLTVVGARQASAAPAVIKRVSTPGQSRGSRSSTLASISTAPANDHPTGRISGARSSAGSLKRKHRRSSHRSARVEARAIPVGVVSSPPPPTKIFQPAASLTTAGAGTPMSKCARRVRQDPTAMALAVTLSISRECRAAETPAMSAMESSAPTLWKWTSWGDT